MSTKRQYPSITEAIRKFSSTTPIQNFAKAAGIGLYNDQVYINKGTGLQLLADALQTTLSNVGAKAGATVSVVETGFNGLFHKTAFTFAATPITMRDTEQGGGVKIYDFPEGGVTILGASGSIAVTTTSAILTTLNGGSTCNWGLGSTTQASATLATTEQDILTVSAFTSSATINVAGAVAAKGRTAAPACFDGHATALDAYLNLAVASATDIDADATVTVTGTATILWAFATDV